MRFIFENEFYCRVASVHNILGFANPYKTLDTFLCFFFILSVCFSNRRQRHFSRDFRRKKNFRTSRAAFPRKNNTQNRRASLTVFFFSFSNFNCRLCRFFLNSVRRNCVMNTIWVLSYGLFKIINVARDFAVNNDNITLYTPVIFIRIVALRGNDLWRLQHSHTSVSLTSQSKLKYHI